MQPLPHRYAVTASGEPEGDIDLVTAGVPRLHSMPPREFDGPGDRWSPETLLVGAVADCFILTFRAVARAAHLSWMSLDCTATGTLDRIDRTARFTAFTLATRLTVPPGVDCDLARRTLERAERNCLVTNSLNALVHLDIHVAVGDERLCEAAGPGASSR